MSPPPPRIREGALEDRKIPLQVLDNRNPAIPSAFDLNAFVAALNVLMTDENLYRSKEYGYGKYFRYATAESNGLSESLRNAKAIRVVAESGGKLDMGRNMTTVRVETVIDEKNGEVSTFKFHPDGKYASGSWPMKKSLQPRLEDSSVDNQSLPEK